MTGRSAKKYGQSRHWRATILMLLLAFATSSCFLLRTDERVDVIVAATNLNAGTQITASDLTVIAIPVSAITQDMPRKDSQVIGHTIKVPISKGQQILLSQLK